MTHATVPGGEHDTQFSLDTATGKRHPAIFVITSDARIVVSTELRLVITADRDGWKSVRVQDEDWYTEFVRVSSVESDAEVVDADRIFTYVQSRLDDASESYIVWYTDTIVNFLRGVYDSRNQG